MLDFEVRTQAQRNGARTVGLAGSITHTSEFLEYELKEAERLNARIAKQTSRCAELKAWEEAEEARSKT